MFATKRTRWIVVCLLAFLLLFAAACSTTSEEPAGNTAETPTTPSTPEPPATPEPVEQILTYAQGLEADSLDPSNYQSGGSTVAIAHIFDPLVNLKVTADGETSLVPALATEWTTSEDGRVWTMKLRQGVKFHDGSDFNADAVKFTFDRILNKDNGFRAYGAFAPIIESVDVIDPYTVQFTTVEPYGAFLTLMSQSNASIVSPAAVEKYGEDFAFNPVGTGAFILDSWVRDDKMEFSPNPDYWDGAPKLEKLIIRPIIEPAAKSLALETGEANAIAAVPIDDIDRLSGKDGLSVTMVPATRQRVIVLNCLLDPLTDKRVRQALNYAVDKEGMNEGLMKGTKVIADAPISSMTFGYSPIGAYPYDPEKAKSLLAEAGVETPTMMHFLALKQARDPGLMDSLQYIRQNLLDVGIDTSYLETDIAGYLAIVDQGPDGPEKMKTHMFAQGYGNPDADQALRSAFHTDSWAPVWTNRGFYSNPTVDELLDKAAFTTNPDERISTYAEALRIIMDEAPRIFEYSEQYIYGVWDNVKGWEFSTSDILLFHHAYIE